MNESPDNCPDHNACAQVQRHEMYVNAGEYTSRREWIWLSMNSFGELSHGLQYYFRWRMTPNNSQFTFVPNLNPQHDNPHNIIRSSQPIVHLPLDSSPAAAPEPLYLFLNSFHFSFSTPVTLASWPCMHVQMGFKRLDTMSMLSLRSVMVSATVNSSGWGPLFCMKNELVVVRVRVIAERLECWGEFQVGEVVGVVCHTAWAPERRRRAGASQSFSYFANGQTGWKCERNSQGHNNRFMLHLQQYFLCTGWYPSSSAAYNRITPITLSSNSLTSKVTSQI